MTHDTDHLDTPGLTPDPHAALADGELDLRASPEAAARLAADPQAAERVAFQQQLRRSVASVMDGPEVRCPEALRSRITALADESATPQHTTRATMAEPAYNGPPVLARIGRWAPAAVAAVLLIAATAIFFTSRPNGAAGPTAPVLDVSTIQTFSRHHMYCAQNPAERLHDPERFGQELDKLPGNLGDFFSRSVDGVSLDLSAVQYDYQLAGVCSIPGSGAVHLVYRHHDHPGRAMSLWIVPARADVTDRMEPGRLYVETGEGLDHPVVLWEDGGLMFYLVGDSLQDVQDAVQALRDPV